MVIISIYNPNYTLKLDPEHSGTLKEGTQIHCVSTLSFPVCLLWSQKGRVKKMTITSQLPHRGPEEKQETLRLCLLMVSGDQKQVLALWVDLWGSSSFSPPLTHFLQRLCSSQQQNLASLPQAQVRWSWRCDSVSDPRSDPVLSEHQRVVCWDRLKCSVKSNWEFLRRHNSSTHVDD